MRRCAAWLVAIPLMLAASQVGHVFAYRLVYPEAQVRWQALLSTGHDYLSYWPLVFGVAGGILVVGFVAAVVDSTHRRTSRPLPAWAFALLPVIGFAVQEFTERWLAGSNFPWWAVLQPTFRLGLLIQLPFALIAFFVARLLFHTADQVAGAMRGKAVFPQPLYEAPLWFRVATWPLRTAVLADGHAGRGPPAAARAVVSSPLIA